MIKKRKKILAMTPKNVSFVLLSLLVAGLFPGYAIADPLFDAVERGDIETVRKLIDQGADFSGKNGPSPLVYSIYRGQIGVAKLLIARGVDVNFKSPSGYTPLQSTSGCDYYNQETLAKMFDLAQLLLANGADPSIANNDGETPRMRAERCGQPGIALLLKKAEDDGSRRIEFSTEDPQEKADFEKTALDYRNARTKPMLPEEARRFKVQAEVAVRDKNFEEAAKLYGKALDLVPWWPDGHFNRAIILGETRYYLGAIREMKRYLTLVPNAPDARAAQDNIYEWELKAGK